MDHDTFITEDAVVENEWKEEDDFITAKVSFCTETVCNRGLKTWDEIVKTWTLWEGQPITFDHPECSVVMDPNDVVGILSDVELDEANKKLTGLVKLFRSPPAFSRHKESYWEVLLAAIQERTHISVGFYANWDFVEEEKFVDSRGNILVYDHILSNIYPDHLASVEVGACTPEQGCGIGVEKHIEQRRGMETFRNYTTWWPEYTDKSEDRSWSPSPMQDYDEDNIEDISKYFMGMRGRWPPEKFGDLIHGCVFPDGTLSLRALRALRGSRGVLGLKPEASDAMIDDIYRRTAYLAKKEFDLDWASSREEEEDRSEINMKSDLEDEEESLLKKLYNVLGDLLKREEDLNESSDADCGCTSDNEDFEKRLAKDPDLAEDVDEPHLEVKTMDETKTDKKKQEDLESTKETPEKDSCGHVAELAEKDKLIEELSGKVSELEEVVAAYAEQELEDLVSVAIELTTLDETKLREMDKATLNALIVGARSSKPAEKAESKTGKNIRSGPSRTETSSAIDLYKHPLE